MVEFYVGRTRDLMELETTPFRVAFITGIGGQGKSALAASFFNASVAAVSFDHRLWRDCKEQSEKFEDHLAYLIEALNDGRVAGGEFSKQPIDVLADLFCTLTEDLRLLVIFDNVDHYVDLETGRLVGAAGEFVTRFLAKTSQARLIFTCRPQIEYPSQEVLSRRLEGLELAAAIELFGLRRAVATEAAIRRAHEITRGHAFWLDLLAAQVANRQPVVALEGLLNSISAGTGEIPDTTLRSIWQSLRDREQIVLQALAETLRPTSTLQLCDYVRGRLRFNQMSRAIRVLRDLNLLVIKELDSGDDGYELHPIIRAFIRKTFKPAERVGFIDAILAVYAAFFGAHRAELGKRPHPRTVQHWLEGAELCTNGGHFSEAFSRLAEVGDTIRRSEPPGEFVRVVGQLLSAIDVKKWSSFEEFDDVFVDYHRVLVHLGRIEAASEALERYSDTLAGKDARYINYCDMQAYMHWIHGNYPAAIKWGAEGAELKKNSGVDTPFTSEHTLALAQRDSGAVDPALKFFLKDATMEEVLASEEPLKRSESFYGNIGRCLQLMGQIDSALICYRKSARLIEHAHEYRDFENQAYIRQWIGELLLAKDERLAAFSFLMASQHKWAIVSPPKAERTRRFIEEKTIVSDPPLPHPEAAEAFVLKWIDVS